MSFYLPHFLPYLLNQAAEAASAEFQAYYKDKYGMLRTEWRVLFHLGLYGPMTAKDICARASLHKTKVSRAVKALEDKRLIARDTDDNDRRLERLSLTKHGTQVFDDLQSAAASYDAKLTAHMSKNDIEKLRSALLDLSA